MIFLVLYGYETWEEHRLRMIQKKLLRRIFGIRGM
jgi:hypothetical protein